MVSTFYHLAVFEHVDDVHVPYGWQSVCYDDSGASFLCLCKGKVFSKKVFQIVLKVHRRKVSQAIGKTGLSLVQINYSILFIYETMPYHIHLFILAQTIKHTTDKIKKMNIVALVASP